MEHRPKLYASVAFFAGVLLCLGFKNVYPDLERRYRRHFKNTKRLVDAEFDEEIGKSNLDDHENGLPGGKGVIDIGDGIEACIGNTPLFKIKSLSELTGCEILGKAEVHVTTNFSIAPF